MSKINIKDRTGSTVYVDRDQPKHLKIQSIETERMFFY